jgi:hypothetical protein
MSWFMTADTGRFLTMAGEFLRADPAGNSVMLTVTENLRVSAAPPAAGPPLYGWWQPAGGPVGAAFMHTPDFPLMLSRVNAPDAGAVTAAVSQAALDAGVREVVLYTDLANPTSNALYQGLGYRPVEDRAVLSFTPARHGLRFTRERTRGLRPAGRR